MDINNYISSGVLEQFVLGLLSEKENSEIIDMMQRHPEVANYVRALEDSLEQYSQLHAIQPPPALKAAVMEGIRAQKKDQPRTQDQDQVSVNRSYPGLWRKLAVAAAVLLLCSIALNIYLGSRNASSHLAIQHLSRKNQQLAADSLDQSRQLIQIKEQIAIVSNPELHPVTMKGVQAHPGVQATVYWSTDKRTVYLTSSDLPAPPKGKVYQLWAIVNGTPVDLGLYSPGQNSKLPLLMKKAQAGKVQAFAITLEKEGGSPTPTMEQMYVMGPVS